MIALRRSRRTTGGTPSRVNAIGAWCTDTSKIPGMSLRNNWLQSLLNFLQSNLFYFLLMLLLTKQQWHSWVVKAVSWSWNFLWRLRTAIIALPNHVLRFLTRVSSCVWDAIAQHLPGAGVAPTQLPVGTPSAIASAMQPAPTGSSLPMFVNNSAWMQWEAVQRHHHQSAVFAMQAAHHGYEHPICTTGTAEGPSLW